MGAPLAVGINRQIARADIPRLCERVRVLLVNCDADQVVCDVGALVEPDAVAVDALARLQLTAKRAGCQLRLIDACGELKELIVLMGLREVMPLRLGLEPGGKPEQWKEVGGVEEEGDSGDATV